MLLTEEEKSQMIKEIEEDVKIQKKKPISFDIAFPCFDDFQKVIPKKFKNIVLFDKFNFSKLLLDLNIK